MSKNITILEGGSTKQMTAEKLKIDLYGGGSSYWVPEDETRLTTKNITENGTYIAEDDGYYGYSEVTVNVQEGSGVVTGLDPDGSGDWSAAWIDPTTGDIVIRKVPSSIRVVVPPSKTSYQGGETINYSGIVVKAYLESGEEWGTVPFNELIFPVSNASDLQGTEWTNGAGVNAYLLATHATTCRVRVYLIWQESTSYTDEIVTGSIDNHPTALGSSGISYMLLTKYDGTVYGLCISGERGVLGFRYYDSDDVKGWYHLMSTGFAGDNVFNNVATIDANIAEYFNNVPESTSDPSSAVASDFHSAQTIPVQWQRTGDKRLLEASFQIEITDVIIDISDFSGEGESGSHGF